MKKLELNWVSKLCVLPLITSAMSGSPYSAEGIYIPKHSRERKYTSVRCAVCGTTGKTLYKVGENRYCAQCKSNLRSDAE
ncbi:MAG: hypothetical protein KBT02_10290 [Treponema sp.]|nr:hypothetical protein [Candidatus Treponema caballi]